MSAIKPFQNEQDSITIGDLTIENRIDQIEVYGSLQITKDKAGLALATKMKALIDSIMKALQNEKLPDHIPEAPKDKIDNPFK